MVYSEQTYPAGQIPQSASIVPLVWDLKVPLGHNTGYPTPLASESAYPRLVFVPAKQYIAVGQGVSK